MSEINTLIVSNENESEKTQYLAKIRKYLKTESYLDSGYINFSTSDETLQLVVDNIDFLINDINKQLALKNNIKYKNKDIKNVFSILHSIFGKNIYEQIIVFHFLRLFSLKHKNYFLTEREIVFSYFISQSLLHDEPLSMDVWLNLIKEEKNKKGEYIVITWSKFVDKIFKYIIDELNTDIGLNVRDLNIIYIILTKFKYE